MHGAAHAQHAKALWGVPDVFVSDELLSNAVVGIRGDPSALWKGCLPGPAQI